MKKILLLFILCLGLSGLAQDYDVSRISSIQNKLEALQVDVPGLSENINIRIQQTTLPTFLVAISEVHKINIDVDPRLSSIAIINNFKDVSVTDVLVYLCKLYSLEIDQTGTILYVKKFEKELEEPEERIIPISYNPVSNQLTADLRNDSFSDVLRIISTQTGKGLFFSPELAGTKVSAFINKLDLDTALEKISFANNLIVTKTKDGSYEFIQENQTAINGSGPLRPRRSRRSNFYFQVLDSISGRLNVDFENTPVEDIVYDIGNALKLNIFTATPLSEAGLATVKANDITFDSLLTKIFESDLENNVSGSTVQGNARPNANVSSGLSFNFKKKDGVYYFGATSQLVLRSSEVVPMLYRPIVFLPDPQSTGRSVGRTLAVDQGFGDFDQYNNSGGNAGFNNRRGGEQNSNSQISSGDDLLSIVPEDIKEGLSIQVDTELNSFVVSGPNNAVLRFKNFVKQIDKPVPMVLIEVMILEIGSSTTLDLGVEWGIGNEPTTTQGNIFPNTDLNLGATTVNRILGRIDGSSFFNIGSVVPNFFANIKASETNGNFKIRSSPRIATMNGHRAYFSNGETTYYAVNRQNFVGTQNPALSQITNYLPIDAELSLEVKPFISADGEITMDLKVIQSTFNGQRIAADAPPGINSREFTSVVKARNNDIIVLGGLEERIRRNNGSGVPFLARIPIIKWLFSKRVREGRKNKLTVLIKSTIIK